MFEDLNKQMEEVKQTQRLKQKWERKLVHFTQLKEESSLKSSDLKEQLDREKVDVEKLEGLSLTALMSTVAGTKDEKLQKEKQDVITAKLKYDEAVEAVIKLEQEEEICLSKLKELGDPSAAFEQLMKDKEELIMNRHSELSQKLFDAFDRESEQKELIKEINEAIDAGKEVMMPLVSAAEALEKAKGWGTFDMLGGGAVSTFAKHSHMDEAKDAIHRAEHKLKNFQTELSDLGQYAAMTLDVSGLLTFADYFFDGIVVDWMVQDKIKSSLQKVTNQHQEVEQMITRLEREKELADKRLKEIQQERIEMVNQA